MNGERRNGYGTGREALLIATVHVVARKGLRGLTFRAVADQAGVNNTLVAHHFGTRDTLIKAALEWSTQQSVGISQLKELPSTEEEFRESILALVTAAPDLQAFQYEMILESRHRPDLANAVQHWYLSSITAFAESLRRIGFGKEQGGSQAAFAVLDGLMLQLLAGVDRRGVDDSIRFLWIALGGDATTRPGGAAN